MGCAGQKSISPEGASSKEGNWQAIYVSLRVCVACVIMAGAPDKRHKEEGDISSCQVQELPHGEAQDNSSQFLETTKRAKKKTRCRQRNQKEKTPMLRRRTKNVTPFQLVESAKVAGSVYVSQASILQFDSQLIC